MTRKLTFTEAINEATAQEMARDSSVVLLGLGVDDERGLQGTTVGLVDKFGSERVFDTPLAEEGMTGIAIGCVVQNKLMYLMHLNVIMANYKIGLTN